MFTTIIEFLYKNKFLRNLFNIPWNPYHDLTFDGLAKNYKKAVEKINKSKKYKKFKETHNLFNKQDLELNQLKTSDIINKNRDLILPIFTSFFKKKIELLDFGGGASPAALSVMGMCKINIKTTVVERKHLVDYINKNLISKELKKYITYTHTLKNIQLKKFNVVYFGSYIQYFKNHTTLLKQFFVNKIDTIIISDTFFNFTKKDFYSLQIQERNHLYPNKFLSFYSTIKLFKKNGYKLIFSSTNSKNIYKHSMLKNDEFELKTLIFSKNKFN
jgi:putative methyltransferase (TIGR04325 family)